MARKYFGNVRHLIPTMGTGTSLTLGIVPSGWNALSSAVDQNGDPAADADTFYYELRQGNEWENGLATITDSVTKIARATKRSSNSNNPIDLDGTAVLTGTINLEMFSDDVVSFEIEQDVGEVKQGRARDNLGASGGIFPSSVGGTGNGFAKFAGPASAEKTFTLPDADATLAALNAEQTFSAKQTIAATTKLQQSLEKITITADNPASGDNNFDALTQAVQYYTTANDTNFTLNVRGDGSTSLNTMMATGEAMTVALLVTNTGTPYYMSGFKIDGSSVTPKWLSGGAPSAGNASAIDLYEITIIKTASATFTVLAQQSYWA